MTTTTPTRDGVMVIPQWAREWQATLFDHGWMIPGYPPELGGRSCTPTQTLIFLEELARRGIPRSLHFGGYAIVGPSLLEFGDDAQQALVARRHPGRHRVVRRHVRAQRRVRPRQPLDPRRRRRRQLRRERPEGLDQLRHGGREVLLLRADRPERAQAQGHLGADHRRGQPGLRGAPAAPHLGPGRVRRGLPHRRRRAQGRTSSARSTTAGASRWGRSPTSAAGCGSRA